MAARAGARHHRAPRRNANRALRIGAGKAGADARQLVEGRGFDDGMTGNSEQSGRPLVDGDEQHVGARAGFHVWHLPKSLLRGDLGWKIILIYLYIEITVCNILSRASGRGTT